MKKLKYYSLKCELIGKIKKTTKKIITLTKQWLKIKNCKRT